MLYRKYWVSLTRVSCLGPVRIMNLIKKFGSARSAWEASREELSRVKGITEKLSFQIDRERNNIDLEDAWQEIQRRGIKVITYEDKEYPKILKNIYAPPALLYVRGKLGSPDQIGIGVVGTRKFTSYGKRTALNISRYLARSGFTVISGLARGIDTFAHSGALEAGGRTVAVLGSGLDIIYPRDNEGLAEEIIKNGALVSEFPLGTLPLPGNFPRRNRIISGLSTGVVVVEAAERSGALITADCALEQGKEVFVVPGNIDSPYSKGCNKLIKEGAVLVEEPAHILQELGYDFSNDLGKGKTFTDLTVEEKELMKIITNQPLHIDDILASSSLSPQKLNTLLTIMELKGAVKQLVGKYFIKV